VVSDSNHLLNEAETKSVAISFTASLVSTNLKRAEQRFSQFFAQVTTTDLAQKTNDAVRIRLESMSRINRIESVSDATLVQEASKDQADYIVTVLSRLSAYLQKESELWGELELFWEKASRDNSSVSGDDVRSFLRRLLEYRQAAYSMTDAQPLSKTQLSVSNKRTDQKQAELLNRARAGTRYAGLYGACLGLSAYVAIALLWPYFKSTSTKSKSPSNTPRD